jgi:tRNA(adenine34) deaminase
MLKKPVVAFSRKRMADRPVTQSCSGSSHMDLALAEARAAAAAGEVPVGCVIVRNGEVVARSRNRTLTDHDPTAHAEMLALRAAAAAIGSERLVDCDVYVTLEPCTMCAGALSFARIRRLYYGAADPKGGAVESGMRFFSAATCHHRPDVYGGIGEQEAAALLRSFFAERRAEDGQRRTRALPTRTLRALRRDSVGTLRFAHPTRCTVDSATSRAAGACA